MLVHDKLYYEGESKFDKFLSIVSKLAKRQCVEFALYCAKDVFHLVEVQHKESAKLCIDLVEKWLIDEKSVTKEELRSAANAAWNASNAAAYAVANTVANAAWAGTYAEVANETAWTATYASWSAYYASWSAYYAVNANNNKLNEYLIIANSYLTKTNISCPNYEIEGKILYLIDELEENIIVHKNKYYVNMNGIENCPEYGFDTQQELLNELFNSKCLFWVFVRNWLDNLYKNQQA